MENSGEAVDDQGSGWFQVKKVLFLSFVKYSHCLVDKEAKKEKKNIMFYGCLFSIKLQLLDNSAYISTHAIDHVFSFAK